MKNILETINLNKHYGKGESLVKAIDNTNIKIKEGELNNGVKINIWKSWNRKKRKML